MMAYVAGFGGGRDRGIRMLEETAATSGEGRTDALFALVLLYNRERRFDEALRALEELRKLYPRNRLVVLEAGSTALRAGRFDQADKLLTEGLAMLAKATGPRIPGEEALWRYKRGTARVELGRADAASRSAGRHRSRRSALDSGTGAGRARPARGAARRSRGRRARGETGTDALRAGQRSVLRRRGPEAVEERRWPLRLKTWIWIIVGLVGLCILCVVAMAGVGFYFFSQHFDTKVVSARSRIDRIRARQGCSSPGRSRSSSSTSAAASCAPMPIAPCSRMRGGRISSTCSPSIPTTSASSR